MKAIKVYSENQKKGIFEMLKSQSTPFTSGERKLFNDLRIHFSTVENAQCGTVILICDGYACETELEVGYRKTWVKIRSSSKGYYIQSSAQGKKIWI